MPNISIKNLTVTYHEKKKEDVIALNDVSLEITSGSFVSIIGYSGSGKSTLLKTILGILPYEGEILIDGMDSKEISIGNRNIGFVSQNYALYPSMTIFENIAFPLSVINTPREEIIERVRAIAEKLQISHCLSRKPKQLSGGQQQRVAIARALVKNPEILVFDEPFSNLDPTIRTEMRLLLRKILKETSATVIYVTHDFFEAYNLSDYIYVINDGKIIESGNKDEIYNSNNEITKSLIPGKTDGINF